MSRCSTKVTIYSGPTASSATQEFNREVFIYFKSYELFWFLLIYVY